MSPRDMAPLPVPQAGEERRVPLPNGAVRIDRYDAAGRLERQRFPDGTERRYTHDAQGRLTAITGGDEEIRFRHGPRSLTAITAETETTIHSDAEGRPETVTQTVAGQTWTWRVMRDAEGAETGWHYPGAAAPLRFTDAPGGGRRLVCGLRAYYTLEHDPETGRSRIAFANGVTAEETIRHDAQPRLLSLSVSGDRAIGWDYDHDEAGRITAAGRERFAYDEEGRLTEAETAAGRTMYSHGDGLLTRADGPCTRTIGRGAAPMALWHETDGKRTSYRYDAQGRRIAKSGPEGETRYAYDLLGQLCAVTLPDGRRIRYIHDGFGRLVGRVTPEGAVYYMVDAENRRVAEIDGAGRVACSYLWLGQMPVACIDGAPGRRLKASYHRAHAGRLVTGDAKGRLTLLAGDPFGADTPIPAEGPGHAGLFGDPETGLLLSGARWLDPVLAEFLTPDSWFGEIPDAAAAGRLKRILRTMPGGTDRFLSPATAYQWCALDPVNALDLNGHNWVGLIFTTISAFLWQMQLTSVALQMEVINIIMEVIFALAGVFGMIGVSGWLDEGFRDWYWRWSIFNLAPPAASYRLMVPFSLWLNGVMKIQPDRAWTLGSVVWERGSDFREIGERAKRDLVTLPSGTSFVSANPVATGGGTNPFGTGTTTRNALLVANTATQVSGTYTAGSPATLTGLTGTTAPLTDVFWNGDAVAVRLPGGGNEDHFTRLTSWPTAAGAVDVDPPLPAAFNGQVVEVRRLDRPWIRIESGTDRIARPIQFLSGNVLHVGAQIPEEIPTSGLTITEFLPAADRQQRNATSTPPVSFPSLTLMLRAGTGASVATFAVGNPLRIRNGTSARGRRVDRTRGTREILLDAELGGFPGPVDVVRLQTNGSAAAGQSIGTLPGAANRRLTAGRLTALRADDGVEIGGTGTAQPEIRIVQRVLLNVTVSALPAGLQSGTVEADLMVPDPASSTAATASGGGRVFTTAEGDTEGFAAGQAVSLTGGGGGTGVIDSVDAAAHTITLTEATAIPDTTAVTLRRLTVQRQVPVDQVHAAGAEVLLIPANPASPANGDLLRIRPAGSGDGGAVRRLSADPVVVAELTETLAGATTSALSVTRMVPDTAASLTNAAVVAVRPHLDYGGPPPVAVGDDVLIHGEDTVPGGDEDMIARVATINGNLAVLDEPQVFPATNTVLAFRVAATGQTAANAGLDEGMVMIPAAMDEDPLTRQEALQNHEMRHVFQEALWGPFFISMPIPWLFHLGFAAFGDDSADRNSKIMRHISLGGLDSVIALIAWGIGGAKSPTTITGHLQADRRIVQMPPNVDAGRLAKFDAGSRIDITRDDFEDLNAVETLSTENRTVTLRFAPNETRFPAGSEVSLVKSEFEQVRKTVQTWFSFNLEQLWADHIPVAWGRALSSLLNRDSWFPGLGLYLLGFYITSAQNTDDSRSPFEQDAAYHSGDLYTSIPLSEPREVFVGQFSRLVGFVQARFGGVAQRGDPATLLSIRLPAGGNVADVIGGADNGTDGTTQLVRLRQNWLLSFNPRVENVVGGLFAASSPGTYLLEMPGQLRDDSGALPDDVVLAGAMPTAFTERDRVIVRDVVTEPATTRDIFETERVTYAMQARDTSASYALRFPGGAAGQGQVDGLSYTAPLHSAATSQALEMTASYPATHPVFTGPGQEGDARLTEAQRTNLVRAFTLTIREITLPAVGPVAAGASVEFELPIAPREAVVTSARPAGASTDARVTIAAGRPARLTFFAPDAVTAAGPVDVELRFGLDPAGFPAAARKTMALQVQVTPT
jgi:YD repeat-containing protein